ncbi:MAG: thiol-disulfide oxidoreductase DCC family protein [Bacteroidales bacterium]
MEKDLSKSIIIFDGYCNLCSNSVVFILKNDKKDNFRFTSLQSKYSQSLTEIEKNKSKIPDSIILLENGNIYTQSSAALRIAKKLRWPFPLAYALIVVPPFIRNAIYRYIARNRYKWFGKRNTCFIPDQNVDYKFLE